MQDLLTSLRLTGLSLLVCCVAYPLVVWGFAKSAVPEKSEGSLLYDEDGNVVGSRLIAQKFTQPKYFWPRPSAADYNAAGTAGSNLSPTNPKITERAKEIITQFDLPAGRKLTPDLVTASGGGLDPHITKAAALLQAPRVAQARELSEDQVRALIEEHTDSPTLSAFGGEELINVLELNIALDQSQENN
jgi:K+-transporting ATPase ATPase C chain